MLCWDSEMPDNVARAYAIWDSVAAGNVFRNGAVTADAPSHRAGLESALPLEGTPGPPTRGRPRPYNLARLGEDGGDLPNAIETVLAARASVYDETGKPTPGTPTSIALKAASLELAVFGIAPVRASAIAIGTTDIGHRASPAELDALIAASRAGSEDALTSLLALAASHLPTPPVPQHFARGHLGGRSTRLPPPC